MLFIRNSAQSKVLMAKRHLLFLFLLELRYLVASTYGIATAYALADTYDKSTKTYQKTNSMPLAIDKALETGIWQST
jgi:hypothetical protein